MAGLIDLSLPNRNTLVIGTSGSGKSSWVKQQTARAGRLLVWDPDAEYRVQGRYHSRAELARAIAERETARRQFRFALSVDPKPAAFEWFCRVVFAVACASRPLVVVAEEIADVTTPGKAAEAWGTLCRRGRKYGVTLFAVTQRPAEADKTIYSQAPFKWVGCLDNETDRRRIAQLCGMPAARLAELGPLDFVYKTPGPGEPQRGRVRLRR